MTTRYRMHGEIQRLWNGRGSINTLGILKFIHARNQKIWNLTSQPTTGKRNLVPSASLLRILEALAKDEIASPFHDTIT